MPVYSRSPCSYENIWFEKDFFMHSNIFYSLDAQEINITNLWTTKRKNKWFFKGVLREYKERGITNLAKLCNSSCRQYSEPIQTIIWTTAIAIILCNSLSSTLEWWYAVAHVHADMMTSCRSDDALHELGILGAAWNTKIGTVCDPPLKKRRGNKTSKQGFFHSQH